MTEVLAERHVHVIGRVEMEDSESGTAGEWIKEDQLVEQARAGDRDAFNELVRRHRAKAYGWASAISRDTVIAEDIVQDALLSAFLHIGKLTEISRFSHCAKSSVPSLAARGALW